MCWVLRNRLAAMGSCCVFLAYLVQPQTSFPGMPRKAGSDEGGLAHFLSKSMLGPLRHTCEYREQTDGAQLQQDGVWTAAYCRPQNACSAFNTFGVICGPAAVRFFSSSRPSAEWHFHLSNWSEPSARQADRGHTQRCDIRLAA